MPRTYTTVCTLFSTDKCPASPLPNAVAGLLDGGLKFRPMTLPDRYIDHGDYRDQLAMAGLTSQHIASTALTTLGRAKDAAKFSLSALQA